MEDKKTSILVIDDEEDVLYCLKNFLARKGYTVQGASTGDEALMKLSEMNADLILLDIVMPGLGGMEVAKIVREKYPNIKIVVATAFPKESGVLSNNSLMEAVVTKPFRIQELYKRLEEVINGVETAGADRSRGPGAETKILFIKAKLLFVGLSFEAYEFLFREFKELTREGQYYDLDFAIDEKELSRKLKFSESDIVVFEESYFNTLKPEVPANILLNFKRISEIACFDLASTVKNDGMLERFYQLIRKLCIKNGLVEIR